MIENILNLINQSELDNAKEDILFLFKYIQNKMDDSYFPNIKSDSKSEELKNEVICGNTFNRSSLNSDFCNFNSKENNVYELYKDEDLKENNKRINFNIIKEPELKEFNQLQDVNRLNKNQIMFPGTNQRIPSSPKNKSIPINKKVPVNVPKLTSNLTGNKELNEEIFNDKKIIT